MSRHDFNWIGLLLPLLGALGLALQSGLFAPPPPGTSQRALHDFDAAAVQGDAAAVERVCSDEALDQALEVAEVVRSDRRWTWKRTWRVTGVPTDAWATYSRVVRDKTLLVELEAEGGVWRIVRATST